ncbi:hypothetical protein [Ruminiclostridium papyrosolvens]|uniref:Membrane protein n=1 Tax=Ruminiclostridium papyrosolvens C7 TaxID=1330534 RepID=U4QY44_9FIRM|nr:hypothetical protein [Ruminiclostridium papyrosolvens]EPR07999.1 membrane protein [Ruminiclostridium papyrosolvens C7]
MVLIIVSLIVSAISAVLAILIILLFIIPLKTDFVLDTDNSILQATALWLHPFIMARITLENSNPILNIHVFGKHVLKRTLKKKSGKGHSMDYLRAIEPEDIKVSTHYGFSNPFDTGITCGAVNMVSQLINISTFENEPDFLADKDYVYLNASAKMYMGPAIMKIFKIRRLYRRDLQWIQT